MSDTPRTDAAETKHEFAADRWVKSDFARELERELTAAIKQRDEARREVCELLATISQTTSRPTQPLNISNWRGWDCFDREEEK